MSSVLSLPSYWKASSLSDCLVLNDSGTWGTVGSEGSGFPVLRSTNIQDGKLTFDDVAWCDISPEIAAKYELQDGDIIITKSSGSTHLIGKNALFAHPKDGKRYLFSNFTQRLRANTSILLPEYLYYYLNSPYALGFLEQMQNTTSGLRNLSMKQYATQIIPLPTLPEQRRIADTLHQIDQLNQWRSKTLNITKDILPSLYYKLFGSIASDFAKQVPLEDVLQPVSGILTGPFGTQLKVGELVDIGNPIYGIENVMPNQFVSNVDKFITDEKYNQLIRYRLSPNDVLLTRMGTIGRSCVVPEGIPQKAIMSYHLFRLRANEKICLPEFLAATLNYSPYVAHQLKSFAAGAVMSGLNADTVRAIRISLPSLKLQEKYVKFVNQHIVQSSNLEASKNLFNQLTSSLLSLAFTGKLTISWREKHEEELKNASVERDKVFELRDEKLRLIDFKEGRVTSEELEELRNTLGNFAVNLASYHSDMFSGITQQLEEIRKPMVEALVSMSQNLLTPFLESFRQSLQNIQLALPVPPDEDEINRQIDLLPLPQEKRAIHDVLDATSLRVLKLAHASPAYFTPEDLTFGAITSTHTSASLRVLDSLGFVRLVEIDGVLRYHVIDANTDAALKPDQLQQ